MPPSSRFQGVRYAGNSKWNAQVLLPCRSYFHAVFLLTVFLHAVFLHAMVESADGMHYACLPAATRRVTSERPLKKGGIPASPVAERLEMRMQCEALV
jgi:hypothetical protein